MFTKKFQSRICEGSVEGSCESHNPLLSKPQQPHPQECPLSHGTTGLLEFQPSKTIPTSRKGYRKASSSNSTVTQRVLDSAHFLLSLLSKFHDFEKSRIKTLKSKSKSHVSSLILSFIRTEFPISGLLQEMSSRRRVAGGK